MNQRTMRTLATGIATTLLGLAITGLTACGPAATQTAGSAGSAIRLGQQAKLGDAISNGTVAVISLEQDPNASKNSLSSGFRVYSICSGSLLKNNIVLTAAHCIEPGKIMAVVFDVNLLNQRTFHKIDGIIIHPHYVKDLQVPDVNPTPIIPGKPNHKLVSEEPDGNVPPGGVKMKTALNRNDLAIVHYTGITPPGFNPVEILPNLDGVKVGSGVTVAGFGIGDDTDMMNTPPGQRPDMSTAGAGVLRFTDVTVKLTNYSQTEIVLDQTTGHGACEGDSGGPAYVVVNNKPFLLGVASWGPIRGINSGCLKFAVYTEVLPYLDFINTSMVSLIQHSQALATVQK